MKSDHNSGTQLQPRPAPAPVQEERPHDGAFLGEETVPLRDAAARELDRDREDRIRVVLGRRRRRHLSPWRPALAVAGAVGLVVTVVAIAGTTSGDGPASTPQRARPTAVASTHQNPPALTGGAERRPATAASVAQARRRAALSARREAARRRARRDHRHQLEAAREQARARAARRRRARAARAARAASPPSPGPVASTPTTAESPPPVVEEAPVPEPAEVPAEAPAEAAPEAAPPPAPTTSSSATPAENEFGFEK